MSYEEQLLSKRARVVEAFSLYPALSPEVLPCRAASPVVEYRTRAKLAVGPKGEIGLFAPGTHRVVDLPGCLALSPGMRTVANAVREEIAAYRIAPYQPERGIGVLSYLDLRESLSAGKVHLTLVLRASEPPLEATEVAESLMARLPLLAGVAANLNPSPHSPQALGPRTVPLAGQQELWEEIGDTKLRYSPGTFSQAHRGQAAYLLTRARELLTPAPGDTLLDVYGGVGMFSIGLGASCSRVKMIESFPGAARDAEAAAKEAKLSQLEVLSAPAEDALPEMVSATGRRPLPQKTSLQSAPGSEENGNKASGRLLVVVNPPRRGLSPEVLRSLPMLGPEKILYVSCDPDTLARDLDFLARRGFLPQTPLEPLDMIPLTAEVETIALLERSSPLPIEILYQDDSFLAVDKPWGMTSHPAGEGGEDIKTRLEAQVGRSLHPVHRLDQDTSGIAVFATRPEGARALGALLARGEVEREYLTLVQGRSRPRGNINRPLREKGRMMPARSRYRKLAEVAGHSLLAVDLQTGRTHQIRRHLAGIGHPVIGDARYGHGPTNRHFAERYGLLRPFLHAHRIAWVHPFTREVVSLTARLPGDLAMVLTRAGQGSLSRMLRGLPEEEGEEKG